MHKSTYLWDEISIKETNRLRAFAILLIITHNFLHWVMNSPGENEFHFSPHKVKLFTDSLWNTPLDAIRIISTYLGHYGVPVFFFLSGYGLTIKYQKQNTTWLSFVTKRLLALYPAVITAAIGFLIYESIRSGFSLTIQTHIKHLLFQISGISNFIPELIYKPIGPWWFIGVIVQFYLIAPLIIKQKKWPQKPFLITIIISSLIIEWLLAETLDKRLSISINHTIIGHLDVCALGILMAELKKHTIHKTTAITILAASTIIFILGNFHPSLWILTHLTATIILISSLRYASRLTKKINLIDSFLITTGKLSIYLFLCNGYLRKPLIQYAETNPTWWKSIYLCIIFVIITYIWALLLKTITQIIQKKINRT